MSEAFLLDTNVISELRKGSHADPGVTSWFADLADEQIFLSVLTVGELRRGIESIRRRDASQASRLDRWLRDLLASYSDRVLPVDLDTGETWGRFNVPDPLPVIDGLLAATAHVRGLTFATRDTGPAHRSGVDVVNPFSG